MRELTAEAVRGGHMHERLVKRAALGAQTKAHKKKLPRANPAAMLAGRNLKRLRNTEDTDDTESPDTGHSPR